MCKAGSTLSHVVSFPRDEVPGVIGPPRAVEIAVLTDEHLIVASGADVDIRFNLGLCRKAEAPCLKLDGTEITYEEASRRVLTAFLSPASDPPNLQPALKADLAAKKLAI